MKRIAIIGGGFSGTMTAIHLAQKVKKPVEIILISDEESFNRGIAFNPYSKKHLLNVSTGKMSAFENNPTHFLDWIMQQKEFYDTDKELISGAFLPRFYYGNYLHDLWNKTITKHPGLFTVIFDEITALELTGNSLALKSAKSGDLVVDFCVLANGNSLPRNPSIPNKPFFNSKNYFQNPWTVDSVSNTDSSKPVLLVGNGLTMVDTVIGLLEQGFKGKIYSLSPHGFTILPHRHPGLKYTGLTDELNLLNNVSLYELVKLFRKHIRLTRSLGISAEPVIDSLRPYTQKIWRGFSLAEKKFFMAKLRHLWGVARHRIPLHINDLLQQMRIDGTLEVLAGSLVDITEKNNGIEVVFKNRKKNKTPHSFFVSRIINCTGPESNISNMPNHFLYACLNNGVISQDELKLGISADCFTYEIIDAKGRKNERLFTLGSNLRGVLWESTAVAELRKQAEQLAENLASR